MRAIPALDMQTRSFRAKRARTDDNTGDADEMRDVCCREAADGGLRDGGVDEELVCGEGLGQFEVLFAAGGVEDFLRAGFEGGFELQIWLENCCEGG